MLVDAQVRLLTPYRYHVPRLLSALLLDQHSQAALALLLVHLSALQRVLQASLILSILSLQASLPVGLTLSPTTEEQEHQTLSTHLAASLSVSLLVAQVARPRVPIPSMAVSFLHPSIEPIHLTSYIIHLRKN